MKYHITNHIKNNNINYVNIPIINNYSWNILTSISPKYYFIFNPNSYWKFGEIIKVVLGYNNKNIICQNINNKIIICNNKFNNDYMVYDNIKECILSALDYWIKYYHNYLNMDDNNNSYIICKQHIKHIYNTLLLNKQDFISGKNINLFNIT